MKGVTKLSTILAHLAEKSGPVEDTAAGILRIVRDLKLRKVESFDEAVKEAYEANGWHTTAGRPAQGDDRGNVPHLVRNYVWEVRAALRDGINVGRCESFYALRQLRAKARNGDHGDPAEPLIPELAGVSVRATAKPNGGLIHDLALALIAMRPRARLTLVHDLVRFLARRGVELEQEENLVKPPAHRPVTETRVQ